MATLLSCGGIFTCLTILLACFVCRTVSLKCLQCMDAAPNGPCRSDFLTQVNTSLEIFPNNTLEKPYYKECLRDAGRNITQNYCVIEELYSSGAIKSFIRDCSDGVSFSFTELLKNNKITQVAPNNFTTCVYDLGTHFHVCLTLCSGDFCNAPRKPPKNMTCIDQGGNNTTCSAPSLMTRRAQGVVVFGATVDAVLGQYFLLPFLVSLVCALLAA